MKPKWVPNPFSIHCNHSMRTMSQKNEVASWDTSHDAEPHIYTRLVDDKFTIDEIAALSKDVKSNVGCLAEPCRLMDIDREASLK